MQSRENSNAGTQQVGAGSRNSSISNMASTSLKMNVDRARFGAGYGIRGSRPSSYSRDVSMSATKDLIDKPEVLVQTE
jgi:hypothetical protein